MFSLAEGYQHTINISPEVLWLISFHNGITGHNKDIKSACDNIHYEHFSQFIIQRHVGDLSNLLEDESGDVLTMFTDDVITLNGGQSIIGRATVVSTGLFLKCLNLRVCRFI